MADPIAPVAPMSPREEAIRRVVEGMAAGGKPVDAAQLRRILAAIPEADQYDERTYAELAARAVTAETGRLSAAAIAALHTETELRTGNAPERDGAQTIAFAREKGVEAVAAAERLGLIEPPPPAAPVPAPAADAAPVEPPKPSKATPEDWIVVGTGATLLTGTVAGVTTLLVKSTTARGLAKGGIGAFWADSAIKTWHSVGSGLGIMLGDTNNPDRTSVENWNNTAGRDPLTAGTIQTLMAVKTGAETIFATALTEMATVDFIGATKNVVNAPWARSVAGGIKTVAGFAGNTVDNLMASTALGEKYFAATFKASTTLAGAAEGFAPALARVLASPPMRVIKWAGGPVTGGVFTGVVGGAEVGIGLITRDREMTQDGVGTLGGVVAGASAGAVIGLLGGPFAPITVPVGMGVGAMLGGLAGALAIHGPEWADKTFPPERSGPDRWANGGLHAVTDGWTNGVENTTNFLFDLTDPEDPAKRQRTADKVVAGAKTMLERSGPTLALAAVPGAGIALTATSMALDHVPGGREVKRAVTAAVTTTTRTVAAAAQAVVRDPGRAAARAADDARDVAADVAVGAKFWDKWAQELKQDLGALQRNYSAYKFLDTDHDGKIELHEAYNVMKGRDIKLTDANHDNKLSAQELMSAVAAVGRPAPRRG